MASRTPNRPPIGRNNTPRLSPAAYLNSKLDDIRTTHGVPALAAVLVRDGGDTVIGLAVGQRKSDLAATLSANVVQQSDRFCIGSVSKPFTGYLMARLVHAHSRRLSGDDIGSFPDTLPNPGIVSRQDTRAAHVAQRRPAIRARQRVRDDGKPHRTF